MRPPLYAQSELLSRAQKKQHKHQMISNTDGGDLAQQDTDRLAAASPKVRKKMAKNSSRHEDRQLPTFECMDPNLPSEYVADSSRPPYG